MAATNYVCGTRAVKLARHKAVFADKAAPSKPLPRAAGPLFSATVHLVTLAFDTPSGVVGVSAGDTGIAHQYATTIAPIVQAYATQYGPNAVAVDPNVGNDTVTPPGGTTYSDADLAGWIDAYAQANGIPAGDAIAVFNPPSGVENSDAPVSQGVLGYHAISPGGIVYIFVNALGTGFTLDDGAGYYAAALSHEIQEAVVDPQANLSNPEVCDPCAGNCNPFQYFEDFDASSNYLGATTSVTLSPPPGAAYAFFLNSMVAVSSATACPAPAAACEYAPPGAAPPIPPCQAELQKAIAELESGQFLPGIEDLFAAIFCYIDSGLVSAADVAEAFWKRLKKHL